MGRLPQAIRCIENELIKIQNYQRVRSRLVGKSRSCTEARHLLKFIAARWDGK